MFIIPPLISLFFSIQALLMVSDLCLAYKLAFLWLCKIAPSFGFFQVIYLRSPLLALMVFYPEDIIDLGFDFSEF